LCSASQWAELGKLNFPVQPIALSSSQSVKAWVSSVGLVRSDYVVIDTPPSEAALGAALAIANVVIIPCTPSGLDLEATIKTLEHVQLVRARRTQPLHVILAPNRVDRRTLEGKQLAEELGRFGEIVTEPIGSRSAFVRSFFFGRSIGMLDPRGPGVQEVRHLLDLVLRCLNEKAVASARPKS
jgi:chromosome partitioning protein